MEAILESQAEKLARETEVDVHLVCRAASGTIPNPST